MADAGLMEAPIHNWALVIGAWHMFIAHDIDKRLKVGKASVNLAMLPCLRSCPPRPL